jgi:hypothetical protein
MSQKTQEYAQQLLSKMVYPDMPADEGLRLVQTNIARFAYGGPVNVGEQPSDYADPGAQMPAYAEGGEVAQMQEEARKEEAYQALEKYLQSRDEMPSIKVTSRMPEGTDGIYTSDNLNIGSGTIKINKNTPKAALSSLLAHEMTHAADRQMKQQAIEQGMFGKSNQYTEAYKKLVGPEGRNRTELARLLKPEWAAENRLYRADPKEIAAHGVGAFSGPTLQTRGPRHVDATAATELQILLDLAQRNVDKGPTGLEKIPAFFRKMGRYADGGDVQPSLTPQQIEQIAAQEALEREKASSPAFLTPKSGKGRQISTKPGELEGAALQGVSEMPYLLAGAPVDLATMAMRPFGYDVEKPMFGSDDLKQRALAAGIRQKPPEGAAARALYEMGQLGASVVNPAAPVRGAVAVAGKTGEAAKRIAGDFQQYNQQISAPGASYAVPPQGRVMAPAPASNLGFYSAAEQAALNLPRKEGPGNAFLNDLMKASDVKKEELEFMGLDEFLRGKPKVTREEVQDFISNNRIDVKEVQLGGNVVEDPAGLAKRKEVFDKYEPEIQSLYKQMDAAASDAVPVGQSSPWNQLYEKITEIQGIRDREADAAYVIPESLPTRFNRPTLVLPGGANYREILLTLPKQSPKVDPSDVKVLATGTNKVGGKPFVSFEFKGERYVVEKTASETDQQAISRRIEAIPGISDANTFRSSHFDQPNILAHMRVNDRVDADGKKMLLIEELQSDWHQAGREAGYGDSIKEGYKLSEQEPGFFHLIRQGSSMPVAYGSKEDVMSQARKIGAVAPGVPDAPFKDTWHQLALKRALKYAADNGYERVGLTTGKQQSQRYNMSQQVDHIGYEPTKKGFYINVISKDGPNVLNGDYTVKELEGIVGKELTQKMLAKEGKNEFNPEIEPDLAEVRRLDGVDLQLEDKGMKKYYDEIYPAFLEKQAKRFNAASGTTQIKTGRGVPGGESVRFVDITPEMQGAVPYAKGGAVERQSTDNRRYL